MSFSSVSVIVNALRLRIGDRAVAEDLLQEAFVRSLERIDTLRDGESVVAWFYRSLRDERTDRSLFWTR